VKRILVVEDEPTILAAVVTRLRAEDFLVETAVDGPSAVATASATAPDLVVLDVMLPGFDGLEVCRRIQAERSIPVLMLTARSDETDMLIGLGVGADDYLTKPFSMRELVARVWVLLRRMERAGDAGEAQTLSVGGYRLDLQERRVHHKEREIT
jgi:DNA-binding response OmpR family regulator